MIKWFRESKFDKKKRQVKPVTTPSMPTGPKHPTTKPKKVFKGPKDPSGYKRKLFIPKKFIVAGLDVNANYEIDQSGYAMEDLAFRVNRSFPVRITWHTEIGNECGKCEELSNRVWVSPEDFMNNREFVDSGCGIYGYSHPGCRCHLEVDLNNGAGLYVIRVDSPEAIYTSGQSIEDIKRSMETSEMGEHIPESMDDLLDIG